MAVNYANGLLEYVEFSGLVCTRKEGRLQSQIHSGVSYFFLDKKSSFDFNALLQFRKYCVQHQIDFIHAHSSSFFWAVLVKLSLPKLKIIWHNHLGASKNLKGFYFYLLKFCSLFFYTTIAVNQDLQQWNNNTLFVTGFYLPNFTLIENDDLTETEILKGVKGKKILCLANLRSEKNHLFLLEVATLLKAYDAEWSFHLVGKDFNDAYSEQLKQAIIDKNLTENVYVYGSLTAVKEVINESDFGILTSTSEGLPVSLLEFGFLGKTVIASNVGDIKSLIIADETGLLIAEHNATDFFNAIIKLIEQKDFKFKLEQNFLKHVVSNYSIDAILKIYLDRINTV